MLINAESFAAGQMLAGRYEVGRLLGAGGMGWVLYVFDHRLARQPMALKLLYPHLVTTADSFARFRMEVSLTRRLSHPSVVQTYGCGRTEQGIPYVTMEYVDGRTLKDYIAAHSGAPRFEEALKIIAQIVTALRFAHTGGIIHRDIKPENILLTADLTVKIADFGLAQMFREESRLTKKGHILGTPIYMSPEQICGAPLSFCSDIYSFGVLTYELCSGRPPFSGQTLFEVAAQHLSEPLPALDRRGEVPEWMDDFLRGCCAKDAADRFRSMEEAALFLQLQGVSCSAASGTAAVEEEMLEHIDTDFRLRSFVRRHPRLWFPLVFLSVPILTWWSASWLNRDWNELNMATVYRLERATGLEWNALKLLLNVRGGYTEREQFGIGRPEQDWALIVAGADPDMRTRLSGNTFLHTCATGARRGCRLRMQRDVLLGGANPNLKNNDGETPLHIAVDNNVIDAVRLLLDNGADPNIADPSGWTPVARALRDRKMVLAAQFFFSPVDVNVILPNKQTLLHLAAARGNADLTWQLIRLNANPDTQNAWGMTALMSAIAENVATSQRRKVIELLARRTNLELRDSEGRTAFDLAMQMEEDPTLLALLRPQGQPVTSRSSDLPGAPEADKADQAADAGSEAQEQPGR